jgi:hypothetical protein
MSEEAMEVPAAQVLNAIAQTIVSPSIPVLAEDLMIVYNLVKEVKTQLAGKHESLMHIFWTLLNLP